MLIVEVIDMPIVIMVDTQKKLIEDYEAVCRHECICKIRIEDK